MSRFNEYDGDGDDEFNGNGWAMWEKRAELAINGKRGRKALAELREALLALPEKRLIADALCTVKIAERVERELPPIVQTGDWRWAAEGRDLERGRVLKMAEAQGEGVCAIGAYLWYRKVKAGADPVAAFDELPTLSSGEEYGESARETAELGRRAGLTFTLAWELASRNDETWSSSECTPEQRYEKFLGWIDSTLAKPPLTAPPRRERKPRGRRVVATATPGTMEMGL